jgi:bifunctional NMN adenylyltransferase/nudix hydrolase
VAASCSFARSTTSCTTTPSGFSTSQETVNRVVDEGGWKNVEITIIGSDRDDTTWYVHAFPQWKQRLFAKVPDGKDLSATAIRNLYFGDSMWIIGVWPRVLENDFEIPASTATFLKEFALTAAYAQLVREYDNAEDYKAAWAVAPYPPVFVTTDAVVIQSGHLLVIVRGALPGEGLWALPGGFLAGRERLKTNAVKEVMEETGIRLADGKRAEELTKALLEKAIVAQQTFDDPDRSSRGRTITTAFLIRLDDTKPLPKVHGMFAPLEDTGGVEGVVETTNAMWVPISEARNRREMWFEDHWSILDAMLGMVKDN